MQHNLQRPRLIVEVLIFASSPERLFAYNPYCRVSPFRIRQMSLNDRDTHPGTDVSFSLIPDRRFHLALIVGPRRLSQSGDRDEVAAISDPCVLIQRELQINAYDRYRRAKDIAEASAHPEPSAHAIK
jgi:hypothetical protein